MATDNTSCCLPDTKSSLLVNGLATFGSAAGLIYGIVEKKRWWMVLLLMAAGGMAGRGIGWVADSKNAS